MSTYAPSVIRHGLPGQIYVAAPLAVIPAGFTLGGRNVSLCPSRREAALSAHRGKSAAVRPRPRAAASWRPCDSARWAAAEARPLPVPSGAARWPCCRRPAARAGEPRCVSRRCPPPPGSWPCLPAPPACPCTLSLCCAGGGCSSRLRQVVHEREQEARAPCALKGIRRR